MVIVNSNLIGNEMKTAKEDSIFEKKLQIVEECMREQGVSIERGNIRFDGSDKVFILADVELLSGSNPDEVTLPREDESYKLVLNEYMGDI